eukprot:3781889-Rhodomonas_salina.2
MDQFDEESRDRKRNRCFAGGTDCSRDSRNWEMIPNLLSQETACPDWIRGHARKLRRGKVTDSERKEPIVSDRDTQEPSAQECILINKCHIPANYHRSPAILEQNAGPGAEAFESGRGRATRKSGGKEWVVFRSPSSRSGVLRCGRSRRRGLLPWAARALCIVLFSLGGWCQVSRDSGWGMHSGDQRRSLSLDSEVEGLDDYFLSGKQKLGKRTFADSYPGVVREASANFQTVDDL